MGQRGHYPYGESWYETGTLTKVKFTTYEPDSESGNDYAMDRTYVSRLGRFSAVDPLSGSTPNPQSLNRYAYALDDPINLMDPIGDDTISDSDPCASDPDHCVLVTADPPDPYDPATRSVPGGLQYPTGGNGGDGGNSSGFTLGIRAPGQTFNQCLVQNAANYSAGGVLDLAAGTTIGNSTAGQVLAGNTFTGAYSALAGSVGDAATVAGTAAPDLLNSAIGSTTTFGRRTSNILALNLAGKGGLPQALSSSSGGLKSLLGSASKALNLGLEASLKAAIDAGLAGAEVIGCSIHR